MYYFSGYDLEIAGLRSRKNATITCIINLCCLNCYEINIILAERRDKFTCRISLISVPHLSRHFSYPVVPDRIEGSRRILIQDAKIVLILILSETS